MKWRKDVILIRYILLLYLLSGHITGSSQPAFRLAPPVLSFKSVIFKDSAILNLKFGMEGAAIRYTLDGTDPVETSTVYTTPIVIRDSIVTIKAAAFCPEYMTSETVAITFYQAGKPIQKIQTSPVSDKYPGASDRILRDFEAGASNFRNGSWMGFQADTVLFIIDLFKKEYISSISLDVLQSQERWIFQPAEICVYKGDPRKKQHKKIGSVALSPTKKGASSNLMIAVNLRKKVRAKTLYLYVLPLRSIPDWHDGKGTPAWFFTDEILVF